MSATQAGMTFEVPLPLPLFSQPASGEDKNSSLSVKRSSSPRLPQSIVSREPSNPLFRPSSNYYKLKKRKPRAALTSQGLGDSGYITDEFGSQCDSDVSKSNADGTESSWRNRTPKGSSVLGE